MNRFEWLLLVGLSILWGGAFFFVEVALEALPPLTLVLLRIGIAAFALHIVVRARGLRMPAFGRTWGAFMIMGALNNLLPFSLIVWGQTHITAGLASILNATTPLFTVVLAHWLTRDERLSGNRIVGVLLGLAGVVWMTGPELLAGLGGHALAQLAVLGAAFSYGCAGVYARRFAGLPPLVTATGQVTASTLLLLPLAALIDHPWELTAPGAAPLAAVVALALASTALAYVIYFRILATAGATNTLLVTLLIPVSALLLGVIVLGDAVVARQIAAMILIGAGLIAVDGRLWRMLRAHFPGAKRPLAQPAE